MGEQVSFPITTVADRCRDCYRCIRSCPVKAIRIEAENDKLRARIVEDLCVLCGRCVLTCPQGAKKVTSRLERVKELLACGGPVVASVAPSFAAVLPTDHALALPALLKALGFALVQQTSWGAELVCRAQKQLPKDRSYISTACPVVVNLVEKYYPELIPMLVPLVSPMVAHGRWIKQAYPQSRVVFIGPCIAKKDEARQFPDAVDEVLGFDELWRWLEAEGLSPGQFVPGDFDPPHPQRAILFPVEGGELHTLSLSTDMLDTRVVAISGLVNCIDFLSQLQRGEIKHPPAFMELLACSGGCIAGPLMETAGDIFVRRQRIIEYFRARSSAASLTREEEGRLLPLNMLRRRYRERKIYRPEPPAEAIKQILAQTGKYTPEDELNCGACGYNSCREKAAAVYWGMAEVQMCIPYMRRRAESMSNLVINAMPNGCIIVNRHLEILEANPAAREMFGWQGKEITGQKLDQLIDATNFRRVLATGEPLNVLHTYDEHDRIIREVIFPLEKGEVVVGILVDITHEKRQQEELRQMKAQTIKRAQEVINKQMKVAQEIAGLLGETTAETKVLLSQLIRLMQE
ncbi:[Fe-Fe] hydrogenase large subunit C-terminal domain-containing protein [Desulfofundulus thermosubterraneus]|uniref:PAS domain S-box-containing protein n=1 Tax=Desulfofundulus thermosubterraneus DSM 16057 TaxID=1121432 RepID=A0A1M6KRZ1_9FIRM|nr:[Fe-Fe] hydrogenase large subunit C-terminal domain-containing protein [Desulfofundulus thermosubterraneus]SHJ61660.1 PAS domain S-box-containing protein [Desulfofundulus thermosubterraneus DSM 16057]